MKIKITFSDDKKFKAEFPDLSLEKFEKFMEYDGDSSREYDKYLIDNDMVDITDYNHGATREMIIIVEQEFRGRVIKFKCFYDSDDDQNFKPEEYFSNY